MNIYTLNGQVLTNDGKWLKEKEGPGPGPSPEEVTIGTQVWTAKNLAIDDGGTGIIKVDNVTANGVNFGTQYYYTKTAAERIAATVNGYHLPTSSEISTFYSYIYTTYCDQAQDPLPACKAITSTSGWDSVQGTNTTGLELLPIGWSNPSGNLSEVGSNAVFRFADGKVVQIHLGASAINIWNSQNNWGDSYLGPVRLIKDS
jgi:uncharacterized protein (TIGR02145 family)